MSLLSLHESAQQKQYTNHKLTLACRLSPHSTTGTLCSWPFLQLKIEAGLLEDCLRDFRRAFRMLRDMRFADGAVLFRSLESKISLLVNFKRVLVKPFHASTVVQLQEEELAHSDECTIGRSPSAWRAVDIEGEHPDAVFSKISCNSMPLVNCCVSIPTGEMLSCCCISSPSFSPRIALGLQVSFHPRMTGGVLYAQQEPEQHSA